MDAKYKNNMNLPTVAQMQLTDHGGSSYVVQLTDGSFIVIDGGHSDKKNFNSYTANSNVLWNYLTANAKGGVPTVSAWMITHFHSDHVDTASEFLIKHKEDMRVLSFAYNHPGHEEQLRDVEREDYWQEAMDCYPDAEKRILTTGEKLTFAGCEIDVLITEADRYPDYRKDQNFISAAFRLKFDSGHSFMVTGDCPAPRTYALCDETSAVYRKDEELRAEVLQVPHHGLPIGDPDELKKNVEFYKRVSPKVCLISQYSKRYYSDERFYSDTWYDNDYLIKSAGRDNCYHHTQTTVVDMTSLEVRTFEEEMIF